MSANTEKYIFITLPRMGSKHTQDELVRGLGVTDYVEGYEEFLYRDRAFRFSLGEYFRNYGFEPNAESMVYFENGELKKDYTRQYINGLPDNCYAYQITYDDGWRFAKRNYVNYYPILDQDFSEKMALLKQHGKSYVIKVLLNQHSPQQLIELMSLSKNIVCYLKADILGWICSYSMIGPYQHSDPDSVKPITIGAPRVRTLITYIQLMLTFCRTHGIPIVINNRGEDMTMFDCTVHNFVTAEFSRFNYAETIENYQEVSELVSQSLQIMDIPGLKL